MVSRSITNLWLDVIPFNTSDHITQISAFTDSVPDDHAPEVLLAHDQRVNAHFVPEQGPKLTNGTFTLNDETFMTLLSLSRRISVSCRLNCRAVIDKGPPCSFFHRGAFGQMVAICATSSAYNRFITLKSCGGFGC